MKISIYTKSPIYPNIWAFKTVNLVTGHSQATTSAKQSNIWTQWHARISIFKIRDTCSWEPGKNITVITDVMILFLIDMGSNSSWWLDATISLNVPAISALRWWTFVWNITSRSWLMSYASVNSGTSFPQNKVRSLR